MEPDARLPISSQNLSNIMGVSKPMLQPREVVSRALKQAVTLKLKDGQRSATWHDRWRDHRFPVRNLKTANGRNETEFAQKIIDVSERRAIERLRFEHVNMRSSLDGDQFTAIVG